MNDGIYRDLADIYDELMNDVPYSRWIEYVEKTFRRFDADPALVLDLACGTGTISLGLAERGYNVIGVDRAQKMIERAEAKRKVGENPQFFCQDLSSMDLPEIQADAAVCLFDSLNYITDYNDLCRAFKCTARHLNPGALFVFDVNTELALAEELFTQDNLADKNTNLYYVWKSRYDKEERLSRVKMLFFMRQPDGNYRTLEEEHWQRAYLPEELISGLELAGFSVEGLHDEATLRQVGANTERMYVIARRNEAGIDIKY
ncbi:MAG: class I SAM-dependent methyltransferase [bacterium]|nr:class I SAM-dependent methyltransferase [bacterium]MDD4153529.1 class I SAM-dependent methyltransferase [bacterium]MDD4559043.1 class I SAM-dependent methyltransferase [bacterium]